METTRKERSMNLALQAIKQDPSLSIRRAASFYKVSHVSLDRLVNGTTPWRDGPPNSAKLTELEKIIIIEKILDRDSRSCAPRMTGMGEMANLLLEARGVKRVGTNWASRFIAIHPELKMRQLRRYNYERALCKDPDTLNAWFSLVRRTAAKCIADADIYNFDETHVTIWVYGFTLYFTFSYYINQSAMDHSWIAVIPERSITPIYTDAHSHHQDSWPTSILDSIEHLTKGAHINHYAQDGAFGGREQDTSRDKSHT